ncbi:MAG: phosphodiester glycosidase family protein [Candidatus Marinimicrobia bacterium]|nr:phosphodiester glycosidase family protein [Candidatus Neomarinimicrobiota bacterium]
MKKLTSILALTLMLVLALTSCSSNREFTDLTYSEKIDDHIIWKVIKTDDMNGSPASINILDIDMNKFEGDIVLAWYKNELVKTSDIAQQYHGLAAINGSFFDMKVGGSVLFLQENGTVIAETNDRIEFINESAYAKDKNGVVMILERPESDWKYNPAYDDIIVSGPLLMFDNELTDLDSVKFNINRHPRTALGITDKYHLILVAVDGRHAEAAGMNMWELQTFMDKLGCSEALNFDGGGSTTMYIEGKTENGVVNYPSDNKKYDHEGERSVANGIVVTGD